MRALAFLTFCLLALPLAAAAQSCGTYEAVERGDTADAVSDRCGMALSDLLELNPSLRDGAPREGTVLRLRGGPRASLNEEGANEGASAEYAYNIAGTWRGPDGRCDREAGSWSFAHDVVRGNAARFDVSEIFGWRDGIVVETVRRGTGAPVRLRLERDGDRLAVTAPGLATDLLRCPGNRPGYLPQEEAAGSDGARSAYDASLPGTWRGETASCGAVVGTWTFGGRSIVANGNDYAIRSFDGDATGIIVDLTREATGQTVAFHLEFDGPDRLRATGPDFVTTLIRCR